MEQNATTPATTPAATATATATPAAAPAAAPVQTLLDDNNDTQPTVSTVPTSDDLAKKPATADRPNWLPEKFKSPEDLAKSYTELEKKISGKVPEKYDWTVTKEFGLGEVTPEIDKKYSEAFRKAGFSQDQVKTMLAAYADQLTQIQAEIQEKPVTQRDQEISNLQRAWGNDYKDRLISVKKFASTLPERVLSYPLADTAEGIQFLESLMEQNRMPNPISNTTPSPSIDANGLREQIRNMRMDDKYKLPPGDPVGETHRQKLYNLYETLDRVEKKGR